MKLTKERQDEIKASRDFIYMTTLADIYDGEPDKFVVTEAEVAGVFRLYDQEFFNGQIEARVISLASTRSKKAKWSVAPEIQFLASKRTSGYGSLSGFTFEKRLNPETEQYDYQKVFFFDICPNLFDTIFNGSLGTKGLPTAAGIGCEERLKCFMLVVEHEIIHLLMSLWDFDSPERRIQNPVLFGPHGSLFKCMLETYFGHTHHGHNLALEGVYVPPLRLEPGTPKETGAGFRNWSSSCYLDSVIMIMLETKTNFWRSRIFDWTPESDEDTNFKSQNADLSEQVKNVLIEDYQAVHEPDASAIRCVNLRELLAIHDPLMKDDRDSWEEYEPGSTYASFPQLYPSLNIDVPIKMIRPEIGAEESITYRSEGAFTVADYMLDPTSDEDYKKILWDEIQSPILVFTHQGIPRIQTFDSIDGDDELDLTKTRAFGPEIIDGKYKLIGVVVLHGHVSKTKVSRRGKISVGEGGGHYTCYFEGKDGTWYHYNDLGASFREIGTVEDLPRRGVWEESRGIMPSMYFYASTKVAKTTPKPKTPKKITPIVFQTEKKEAFKSEIIDYVRVDRPDHGVIFIVMFKVPGKKNAILKAIRGVVDIDPASTETKMDEEGNKYAWRVTSAKDAARLHAVLAAAAEQRVTPPKTISIYSALQNKAFTVYDYSAGPKGTVAVVGSGVSKYSKELSKLGLESTSLKHGLGNGFIIPKTKLRDLKKLIGF